MNEFLLTISDWYYFQYQNRAQVELPWYYFLFWKPYMNEFLLTIRTPWYYFQYQNRAQVGKPYMNEFLLTTISNIKIERK